VNKEASLLTAESANHHGAKGHSVEAPAHHDEARPTGVTSDARRRSLRALLERKPLLRALEVHNGLTGLIAENARIGTNGSSRSYDCMWSSSLTDSTAKGKPDIEAVDMTSRMNTVNDIFEVTTKPMIFDGDTGGRPEHFSFTVRSLERLGVSAVVIEDKIGLKKNSLLGNEVEQTQDSIADFCHKIVTGRSARITSDFMVVARCESLILDKGMRDALERCEAYASAGADGILIHSRKKQPDEIFAFCREFKALKPDVPLIVVPTSFNATYEHELIEAGVRVVIYANHMLRSAYPAMMKAAQAILENGRSLEIDRDCISINQILDLIPGTR
jgi:phosphoenolpyruvate phosphomutase / 2-hydroxyethylphosphonate cytidylyltransferase